jgi:hypothetical protein
MHGPVTKATLRARRAGRSRRATLIAALCLAAAPAPAAVIVATPQSTEIDVGAQVVIDVQVQLGVGEMASIFEADFELVGFGTVAGVTLAPGGPTWPSSDGNVAGGVASVSLTSNNAGSNRRVGQLTVTGVQAGTLEVRLGQDTILQRDIVAEPFFEDVPLTTAPDTLLASVDVVPEPDAFLLGAGAVAALALQRTRARSRSNTATKFS